MIRNIIFDLGGVLFQIEFEKTFIALSKLTGLDLRVGYWPDWFKEKIYQYETGYISTESFLYSIQTKNKRDHIPHGHALVNAWNAMLIGWYYDVFKMLNILRNEYRLFLLSNISPLHIQYLADRPGEDYGLKELRNHFEKLYFSCEIGYRKPHKKCFEMIIEENDLKTEETMFIDDYPKNILEASNMGLHCMVHNPNYNIIDKIKKYLDVVC